MSTEAPPNVFTDEEVAALEETFTDVARIPHELGRYEMIVAPAQKAQWRVFMANIHADDANTKASAQSTLIMQTIVGLAWKGQKVSAAEDTAAAMKPVRDLFTQMLNTRGFAGAADGPIAGRLLMRLNNGAIEAAAK